ncbi:hypothetical protein SAMN02745724_02501 [Pseudoalteromonas denitrificans DSM 6059]|uniref:Uncharacterized protein n=2 Tax=Pseudoalteromonas TaxID=53246 RepID=A0A1I1LTA1_9GAMM|nr:hypothetical protein SAMN02745724_02501 [Pseudoalteromonas denitrificans DSM 6059]
MTDYLGLCPWCAAGGIAGRAAIYWNDYKCGKISFSEYMAAVAIGTGAAAAAAGAGRIGQGISKGLFPSKFVTSYEQKWYTLWLYKHKVIT